MLADAVLAEAYRMGRNRFQLVWSVFLVPVLFVLGGVAYHLLNKINGDRAAAAAGLPDMPSSPLNIAESLMFGASQSANGALLVFMLIGVATLYAGDYRWETWRLISARNSRVNLILGKVGVAKMMALAATLLLIVASILFSLAQAVIYTRATSFSMTGEQWGQTGLLWLLGYVRVVQYGLIALLAAVATRSIMASLFLPWGLGFVQTVLGSLPAMLLLHLKPNGWVAPMLLPGMAFDALKRAVLADGMTPAAGPPVPAALLGLALWVIVPLALAMILFQRQDLSKE